MRFFSLIIVFCLLLFLFPDSIDAAKKSVQGKQTKQSSKTLVRGGITASYSLRKDKRALTIFFSNLKNAKSVTYLLTYEGNGVMQGAMGTITPKKEKSTSRTLLFGTCSSGTCVYHTRIKNMSLEVTSSLKNRKTFSHTFKIKL